MGTAKSALKSFSANKAIPIIKNHFKRIDPVQSTWSSGWALHATRKLSCCKHFLVYFFINLSVFPFSNLKRYTPLFRFCMSIFSLLEETLPFNTSLPNELYTI